MIMDYVSFQICTTKSKFVNKLINGDIDIGSIVLIKDTRELWVHGTYISTKTLELVRNLEEVTNGKALDATQGKKLKDLIAESTKLIRTDLKVSSEEKRSHVVLTQSEYDLRKEGGLLSDDVFYYVLEDEVEEVNPEV